MIQNIIIIFNLFLLESMLSIDNAAVLAIMVKDLPVNQQKKALRYGIFGAFAFRGISLFIASWLIKLTFLKILGGVWLLWLFAKNTSSFKGEEVVKTKKITSLFKAILMVELMDIAFSIDNVFAAVSFTSNIYLILIGVFIGILAMRFMAGWFVELIKKFRSLETSAFVVIGLLGCKLIAEGITKITMSEFEVPNIFNVGFSIVCMAIFFFPLLIAKGKEEV